ncbi:hypothetical protein ABZ372_00860, partial [Streptomyces sp. NPDC005921]
MRRADELAVGAEATLVVDPASAGHPAAGHPGAEDAPVRELPRFWPLLLVAAAVVPGTALFLLGQGVSKAALQAWQ